MRKRNLKPLPILLEAALRQSIAEGENTATARVRFNRVCGSATDIARAIKILEGERIRAQANTTIAPAPASAASPVVTTIGATSPACTTQQQPTQRRREGVARRRAWDLMT